MLQIVGVVKMKSLRTYNMQDSTIRILKSKPNKSQFVNLAVHKLHSQEMYFDISNVSTKQLLAVFLSRIDDDDPLRRLIEERIKSES